MISSKYKHVRLFSLILIISSLISSVIFIQALSTSVPGTIVVQLDEDASIKSASRVLQENVKGISLLKYNSFKFLLISNRILQPIIWIGHGSTKGISINKELITWNDFSNEIEKSRSKDIILSCHSNEIIQQTDLTEYDAITFYGKIDSNLGGLISAYILTRSALVLTKVMAYQNSLIRGDVDYNPLFDLDDGSGGGGGSSISFNFPSTFYVTQFTTGYVFFQLSGIELSWHLIMLIVLVLNLIIGAPAVPAEFSLVTKTAVGFYQYAISYFLIGFAYYVNGDMTGTEFFEHVCSAAGEIAESFGSALANATAAEWSLVLLYLVLAGIIIGAEAFVDAITASGAATAIRIIVTMAAIAMYLTDFISDCIDSDGIVG